MFFFFNDTATTEIYTLSLHDALPIYNIAAAIRGGSPKPFSFGGLGMFCLVGHGAGVGETKFGIKIKGRLGWFMWRGVFGAKMPSFGRGMEVAGGWVVDLFVARALAQGDIDTPRRAGGEHSAAGRSTI